MHFNFLDLNITPTIIPGSSLITVGSQIVMPL